MASIISTSTAGKRFPGYTDGTLTMARAMVLAEEDYTIVFEELPCTSGVERS